MARERKTYRDGSLIDDGSVRNEDFILDEDNPIRVVVVENRKTGKSCLIQSALSGSFGQRLSSVLPTTIIPADYFPFGFPVTVLDTSLEEEVDMVDKLKQANIIVLTYACNRPDSFSQLEEYWFPKLHELNVDDVLVLVVGCKRDLPKDPKNELWEDFNITCKWMMERNTMIEHCLECSAKNADDVLPVFHLAIKAALYPLEPLIDKKKTLSPQLFRALKRIFTEGVGYSDRDIITYKEFNENIQVKCHGTELSKSDFAMLKSDICQYFPQGVDHRGCITFTGFLYLHGLMIENDHRQTTWTNLIAFGYDFNIKQKEDWHRNSFYRAFDQSVELTTNAKEYLEKLFKCFNPCREGVISAGNADHLFSKELESCKHYKDGIEMTPSGGLSLCAFLSMCDLVTLWELAKIFVTLIDLGYLGSRSSAFHISQGRRLDVDKQQSERNVFQGLVFGVKRVGKSTLLDDFLRRTSSTSYTPTVTKHFATRVVEGTCKTLVLEEIPEDKREELLNAEDLLGRCDVALLLYQRNNQISFSEVVKSYGQIVRYFQLSGFKVPCLFIDVQENHKKLLSKMVRNELIDIPCKNPNDVNEVFLKIVEAAMFLPGSFSDVADAHYQTRSTIVSE